LRDRKAESCRLAGMQLSAFRTIHIYILSSKAVDVRGMGLSTTALLLFFFDLIIHDKACNLLNDGDKRYSLMASIGRPR
jgi:hypothetical protein